jgi:hypothetical protein
VYDEGEARRAADAIVDGADTLAGRLVERDVDHVRARPAPATWSTLEYGCHVRDVLLVQRERVLEARRTDTPAPTPMGRDERVAHDGYAEQAPGDVARQLRDAAALFANVLRRVDAAGDWDRTIVYNYPTRVERSLRWVAVHTVHEVTHHLYDTT